MADVMVRNLGYSIQVEACTSFGQDALNDELGIRDIPSPSKVRIYSPWIPEIASLCLRLMGEGLTIGFES